MTTASHPLMHTWPSWVVFPLQKQTICFLKMMVVSSISPTPLNWLTPLPVRFRSKPTETKCVGVSPYTMKSNKNCRPILTPTAGILKMASPSQITLEKHTKMDFLPLSSIRLACNTPSIFQLVFPSKPLPSLDTTTMLTRTHTLGNSMVRILAQSTSSPRKMEVTPSIGNILSN